MNTNFILLETRILDYILPLRLWVYLCWNFSGGLCKTILFLQEWPFGRSRSSKVIDFCTNQSVYATSYWSFIVTLVLFCTVSEILQVFLLLTAPLFHPNFGGFPSDQVAHVGVSPRISLKLFGREIIFEVFQPMWSRCLNGRDGQTDGRTDGLTDRRYTVASAHTA